MTDYVRPRDLDEALAMRAEHPELYGMLARYFQQDPAADGN